MTQHALLLQKIKEARELCDKATPGPWQTWEDTSPIDKDYSQSAPTGFSGEIYSATKEHEGRWSQDGSITHGGLFMENAKFICRARTLLPALLEQVQKQVEEHTPTRDGDCDGCQRVRILHALCPVVEAWAKVFGLAPMEEK